MRLMRPQKSVLIKKYGNRRLYDTRDSRYITLTELAQMVREGADVRVIDAKSSEDLTQATLVQIILDGRGAGQLLPTDLLTQLVRMEDEALAEFFGRYMAYALDLYNQTKQGVQAFSPLAPFAANPLINAANSIARMWGSAGGITAPIASNPNAEPPPGAPEDVAESAGVASQPMAADIDALRRQVEELKATLTDLSDATASAKKRSK